MAEEVGNRDVWNSVDAYLVDELHEADPVLDAALEASTRGGLPAIQVSATQGKFLMLLAQTLGARRILEIGTLGGYSTIWLARGLAPGGSVVTLEFEPKHASVARENLERAGFAASVDVRVGRGLDLLPGIEAEGKGPFDLTFIDADKVSSPDYFRWALRLSRPGSLIVLDNVVRGGNILNAASEDASVRGMREALALMGAEQRVDSTAIQTVGSKGYDGFAIARVR